MTVSLCVVPLSTVIASATEVTVVLTRSAVGSTVMTYGYGRSPGHSWILAADGSGNAIHLQYLSVAP